MQEAATGRYNPSETEGKMPATGNGLSNFIQGLSEDPLAEACEPNHAYVMYPSPMKQGRSPALW